MLFSPAVGYALLLPAAGHALPPVSALLLELRFGFVYQVFFEHPQPLGSGDRASACSQGLRTDELNL